MTDGFTEFFCLYLYGVYTIDGATVLEVIDFMIDKTYFMLVFKYSKISVLEGLKYYTIKIFSSIVKCWTIPVKSEFRFKWSENHKSYLNDRAKYFYSIDPDDDNLILSLDGIYKQIYVGFDIPLDGNILMSMQPVINDIISYLDDT